VRKPYVSGVIVLSLMRVIVILHDKWYDIIRVFSFLCTLFTTRAMLLMVMMFLTLLARVTTLGHYLKQIVRREIIGAWKRFQHSAKNIPFVMIGYRSGM
jgi:hypothetical protein